MFSTCTVEITQYALKGRVGLTFELLLNKCEEKPYHVGRLTAFRTILNCFLSILRRFLSILRRFLSILRRFQHLQPSLFTLKHVFRLFIHEI